MLTWTELPDKTGLTMTAHTGTWLELINRFETVGTFPGKDSCPLIKGAIFGDKRSANGSLRTNENVQAITFIEGDYDGEIVTMEQAQAMLERRGIKALIYPSPSNGLVNPPHSHGGPRWRVIALLAMTRPPADRAGLVARLNGALGGILAGESFTLSQGYFFGDTKTNDYRVLVTFDNPEEGTCIDDLDALDEIAKGKTMVPTTPSAPSRANAAPQRPANADPAVIRDLRSALTALRADDRVLWVAVGHALKTLGEQGRSLWLEWSQTSAKYEAQDAATKWDSFNPTNTGHKSVFAKAQAAGWVNPASKVNSASLTIDNETGEILPPMLKPVSVSDVHTNPSQPPQFVWDDYLPRGVVTLMGAHGGTGKSTIALMLGVCTALGRPLFGVDTVQCKTLFVSLEDSAHIVRHRLAFICSLWDINPASLDGKLHIVDGTENPELFSADSRGAGETTATYSELRELVQFEDVGLVVVDNASDAYGGDEIQRRQVRAFIRALVDVARLNNCAVMLLAHVDKATSRARNAEGGEGYSGSTAWHNSARSRLFMTRTETGTLTIEHQKSNLGRCRERLTLEWPDAGLPQLLGNPIGDSDSPFAGVIERFEGRAADERAITLLKMIAEFESREQYCSPVATARNNVFAMLKSEPAFQRLKLNADRCKGIITQCQRAKWIEPVEYRTHDRKTRPRWTLTSEGRAISGLSAPCAPCIDESAERAESAGGAPCAPSCAGGVGEERAHFSIEEGAHLPPRNRTASNDKAGIT